MHLWKHQHRLLSFAGALTFGFLSTVTVQAAAASAPEADSERTPDKHDTQTAFVLDEIIVTANRSREPLTLDTDPKRPRQPVPAADGGGYLKNLPGFSLVRKGGISGDPMLRGMGGTRLNVRMDGGNMFGGCPGRMDPTTTYAFPETFSRIVVRKGPQSVRDGASISGAVLFERETKRFQEPDVRGNAILTFGSSHRFDDLLDVTAGDKSGYVRLIQTRNYADDYADGSGRRIHSGYGRYSLSGIVGLTPDKDTLLELAYDMSRGHAKFAHAMMDGSQFDRDSWTFKYNRANLSPVVTNLDVTFHHAVIDHIMDNYSLRSAGKMGTDVKRTQYGVRAIAELAFTPRSTGAFGFELQNQEHAFASAFKDRPIGSFRDDMGIRSFGVFFEHDYRLHPRTYLRSGIRYDRVTNDYHNYLAYNMRGRKTLDLVPGETADNAYSGFIRYEYDYASLPLTFYVGLGHAERPADYWESFQTWKAHSNRVNGQTASPDASRPNRERNTQLDLGWLYARGQDQGSLSLFYAHVDDFILRLPSSAYGNVDARLYGMEAEYTHSFSPQWSVTGTLSFTHGDDTTNHAPLPQIAPLEGSLAAKYRQGKWEANLLWRLVDRQNRYRTGYGSETGVDHGPTGGFGIVSASCAYRAGDNLVFSLGVDNLFNKNYAEFVSYNESAISNLGITARDHINEPGRTFWFKTNYQF